MFLASVTVLFVAHRAAVPDLEHRSRWLRHADRGVRRGQTMRGQIEATGVIRQYEGFIR